MKPKIVSLFSGAGGMDLGFKQAGFEILLANDFEKDACNTYKKNIDNNILEGDVKNLKENDVPKNIDVLIGGFPCQGFSIANKNRNENDERNSLYKEMIRIIKSSNPKIIVAENVKGILSLGKGEIFKQIQADLKELGYDVSFSLFNTAYFGVPQFRERVIIIANKIGVENIFPDKTYGSHENPFIPVKSVISHLAEIPISYNSFELL